MAAPRTSLAAHFRRQRQAFLLALELGCTPREAEAEMRRREARERWRAGQDRLAARMNAPLDTSGTAVRPFDGLRAQGERDRQPWMMRD